MLYYMQYTLYISLDSGSVTFSPPSKGWNIYSDILDKVFALTLSFPFMFNGKGEMLQSQIPSS